MAAGNSVDAEQLLKDGHTPPHQCDSPSGDEVRASGAESVTNIPAPATASEEPSTCVSDTPAQAVAVPEADRSSHQEYPMDSDDESFRDPLDDLIDYIRDMSGARAESAIVEHDDLDVVLKDYHPSLQMSMQEYIQWYLQSKRPPILVEDKFAMFDWEKMSSPDADSQ